MTRKSPRGLARAFFVAALAPFGMPTTALRRFVSRCAA